MGPHSPQQPGSPALGAGEPVGLASTQGLEAAGHLHGEARSHRTGAAAGPALFTDGDPGFADHRPDHSCGPERRCELKQGGTHPLTPRPGLLCFGLIFLKNTLESI